MNWKLLRIERSWIISIGCIYFGYSQEGLGRATRNLGEDTPNRSPGLGARPGSSRYMPVALPIELLCSIVCVGK